MGTSVSMESRINLLITSSAGCSSSGVLRRLALGQASRRWVSCLPSLLQSVTQKLHVGFGVLQGRGMSRDERIGT